MLPIAFAVVKGETKDSWSWCLELLTSDLGGVRLCNTYTFISGQQKVLTSNWSILIIAYTLNSFRLTYP